MGICANVVGENISRYVWTNGKDLLRNDPQAEQNCDFSGKQQ